MSRPTANDAPDLDRVAMVLSGLCLLHCLALPLAFAAMPFFAGLDDGHWHLPMLAIAMPVSLAAIVIGYRRHGNRAIVAGAALGLGLLLAGATVGHAWLGVTADRAMSVGGSLLLAAVHWQNSLRLRQCRMRAVAPS